MDPFVHATALRYYSHSRRIGVKSSILFPVPGRVWSGSIPTGGHSYSLRTVRRYVPVRKGELFRICPANLVNHPFYVIQNSCHTSIIKALIILIFTLRPLFICISVRFIKQGRRVIQSGETGREKGKIITSVDYRRRSDSGQSV